MNALKNQMRDIMFQIQQLDYFHLAIILVKLAQIKLLMIIQIVLNVQMSIILFMEIA